MLLKLRTLQLSLHLLLLKPLGAFGPPSLWGNAMTFEDSLAAVFLLAWVAIIAGWAIKSLISKD